MKVAESAVREMELTVTVLSSLPVVMLKQYKTMSSPTQ